MKKKIHRDILVRFDSLPDVIEHGTINPVNACVNMHDVVKIIAPTQVTAFARYDPVEIIKYPHPTLRYRSKPLKRIDAALRETITEMFQLMMMEAFTLKTTVETGSVSSLQKSLLPMYPT